MSTALGANGGSYNYPEIGDLGWGNDALNFVSAVSAALTKLGLGSSLTASTVIDIVSTAKGILIPRMTTMQRDAISIPPTGLLIYNTTLNSLDMYYSSSWHSIYSLDVSVLNSPDWDSTSTTSAASVSASAARFVNKTYGLHYPQILIVRDEKTTGTDAGTFSSGAWRTREINTIKKNTIVGASLSSNQITLPEGTYKINAVSPCYAVGKNKSKLYNITDASNTSIGTSNIADISWGESKINDIFTIAAAQEVFEIQHQCSTTRVTDGFGIAGGGYSVIEVYTSVEIIKLE